MAGNHEAAVYEWRNLQQCKQLAARIQKLRSRPAVASEHERVSEETTSLIEKAARSAGIQSKSLMRITPGSARKIQDTTYREEPTQTTLKNITLKQLVGMLYALTVNETALHPKSIRLTSPSTKDTGDLWNVELVLTYLIYDLPKTDG